MTEALLDYLRALCAIHIDFQHGVDRLAYYEFDWAGLMSARQRNDVILYVHKIQGRYNDNKGDYRTDTTALTLIILKKVAATGMSRSRAQMLACKAYGEQFIARMRHDQANSEDADTCALLKRLLLDEITYEQTELTNDGWTGVQFRLPFRAELTTTYNADLWQ